MLTFPLILAPFTVDFVKKRSFSLSFLALLDFSFYFCRRKPIKPHSITLKQNAYSLNTTLNIKID